MTRLHSPEYLGAPWSWGKFFDLLAHLPVPMSLLGISGTGALIGSMRGTLLDELSKQYVITARAKGLKVSRLLFNYPVRLAVHQLISTIGWMLRFLGLRRAEDLAGGWTFPRSAPCCCAPCCFRSMYLAGGFVIMLSTLVVAGTLISDVMLAWIDPRIRFGQVSET